MFGKPGVEKFEFAKLFCKNSEALTPTVVYGLVVRLNDIGEWNN
jgi:hypothetical protein